MKRLQYLLFKSNVCMHACLMVFNISVYFFFEKDLDINHFCYFCVCVKCLDMAYYCELL